MLRVRGTTTNKVISLVRNVESEAESRIKKIDSVLSLLICISTLLEKE